jgi:hypothetical protein
VAGQFEAKPEVRWHWNGQSWCPVSADGTWYWDSNAVQWQAVPSRLTDPLARPTLAAWFKRIPPWLRWTWLVWLVPLVMWVPVLEATESHHAHASELIILAAIFGAAAVLATAIVGVLLGYRTSWRYLGWSILVGTLALGIILFFAAAAGEPSNGQDDPGMGIGAMFVTALCVPPIALLLSLGGVIGSLAKRFR